MPQWLKWIAYAGVFLFSFLLFAYWMFPMEALKSRLILGVEKALGPSYQVSIEEMETYRLTGAWAENIVIQKMEEGQKTTLFRAEAASARLSLFSLLFGTPKVRLNVKLEKGKIDGHIQKREESFRVEGSFRDLDMGKIPYFQASGGLQLASQINGKLNLFYSPKQPLRTEGEVEIFIKNLQIKESTATLGEMGTFPLPDLGLAEGPSSIRAKIGRGSIQVEGLQFKGDDFQLDLKGRVFMASEPSHYRMNLQGHFQFSPKLWEIFDPLLPELFAAELKKQKGTNDLYPVSISGQLTSPQIYSGALRLYPFKPF